MNKCTMTNVLFEPHEKHGPTHDNLSTVKDVMPEREGILTQTVQNKFFHFVIKVLACSRDAQAKVKDQTDLEQTGAEDHENLQC